MKYCSYIISSLHFVNFKSFEGFHASPSSTRAFNSRADPRIQNLISRAGPRIQTLDSRAGPRFPNFVF